MKRRAGHIRFSRNLVDNHELMADILGAMRFVPGEVSFSFADDLLLMTGISFMFNDIEVGSAIPEYYPKITYEDSTGDGPAIIKVDV